MNGGRKRRLPVNVVAVVSLLVLAISVVTAQQVFNGNGQPAFVRRQPQFQQQQPQFAQNRNFVLPSASPLRHRILFTRQISHRHRPRQRSFSLRTSTHQPSVAQLTAIRVPSPPTNNRKRIRSRTKPRANQRTSPLKANISRRQQQQLIPQRFGQQQQFLVPRQQFRFRQPPLQLQTRVQNVQNVQNQAVVRGGVARVVQPTARPVPQFRAPLSPMPFGSVQRTGRRLPQNNLRLSLRPPTRLLPTPPPLLTTTTPLPTTPSSSPPPSPPPTTTSVPPPTSIQPIRSSQSLRRPIRVQQASLDLRRKPQMTRGQFRRPHSSSSNLPLIRHQPTHRVKPDRVTRPIASSTEAATTTTPELTTTAEELRRVNHFKQVDDIEAAILQAVIDSSSPDPPPSSSHRPRTHRIRPGQRHRTPAPPRVDSIEEAVLRAVLESEPSTTSPEELTTVLDGTTSEESTTEEPTTTTTVKSESTSLFPAFATRRQTHRRRTTHSPTTTLATTQEPTTTEPMTTTETTTVTTEEATTSTMSTTISEEPTTTTEGTTTSSEELTAVTIALPEEEKEDTFEDINAKIGEPEDHQLHQIEQNVIAALSTPPPLPSPSSPSPSPTTPSSPAPPAPPTSSEPPTSSAPVGPPGSMPPSDDIVDELNGSTDFLQVAQRLHLLRRLLQ